MTGAESLIRSLVNAGVEVCFTNPGTSEIYLVAALDRVPEMRCVLGLFEGVVTGAADGYARMTRKPGCTLLHLGPGLANGLANLHNASRAQVPIVNIVGQHATYHLGRNTPLESDIEALARVYSNWLRTSRDPGEIGSDGSEAVAAALTAPGQIATLITAADATWGEGGIVANAHQVHETPVAPPDAIEKAARILRSGVPTAILLSGDALFGKPLRVAGSIAAVTEAKLFSPYPVSRVERGAGRPAVERIPYILEQAQEQLKPYRHLIVVGATPPFSYFAYPGKDSRMTSPECEIHYLARAGQNSSRALEDLAAALSLSHAQPAVEKPSRPEIPTGPITLNGLASAVGALLPENAIVIDEAMTSGRGMMAATRGAPPHDWLGNTGGSIGIAFPLAIGAAVACPNRPVLCLTADGSGMYTAQGLWTMAREGLKVINVVFANRSYSVLKREFSYLGIGEPGPRASAMFDIGHPDLDWVSLATGMGVPGVRVTSLDEFARALRAGFESEGPILIDVPL